MEFSDIALAKLLQTTPELGSLILTFQDVTEELGEEKGVKVGVFVLRAGPEIYYVPVISKGDSVYPVDSVYSATKQKFFPLNKKSISRMLATGQLEQGKPRKIPDGVSINPSVYQLINPPRTGKYVYASTGRMIDLMAAMPSHLKKATFDALTNEKDIYDNLDKMFSLKAIFDALKGATLGAAAVTNESPVSAARGAGPRLSDDHVQAVLKNGFVPTPGTGPTRVAISVQDFNHNGLTRTVSEIDGDQDYEIAFSNGTTREAFVPRMHKLNRDGGNALALFTNGDYARGKQFVAVGRTLERKHVLTTLFENSPPVLLKELVNGDTFVIVTNSGEILGPFTAGRVSLNTYGVEVEVCTSSIKTICGYRNFAGEADLEPHAKHLYVPSNSAVIRLCKEVSFELEQSAIAAARRREYEQVRMLGSELNIGFDGVEYSANGRPVGDHGKMMEVLVLREGIDPGLAETFVKQANEAKFIKVYLSKQASSTDYNPSETPQYGILPNSPADVGPNGAFLPNIQQAAETGDSQVVEATIISELLQCPDMFEYIAEYLPDVEEAIDKMGRIMMLSRVHIDKLAQGSDAESVFALLAQLKATYRMLGDSYLTLENLVSSHANFEPQT